MNEEVINLIVLVGLLAGLLAFLKLSLRLRRENQILEQRLRNTRESLEGANERARTYKAKTEELYQREHETKQTIIRQTEALAVAVRRDRNANIPAGSPLHTGSRRVQLFPDSAYGNTDEIGKVVAENRAMMGELARIPENADLDMHAARFMGLGYPPAFVADEPCRAVRVDVPAPAPCAPSSSDSSYSSSYSSSSDSSSSSSCDSGSSGSCGGGD